MSGKSVLCFSFTLLVGSALGQSEGFKRDTAWEGMLSKNPAVVDDPSISWMDRLVLHVLTPEQARDYYQGADPESLTLADGETLAEYLAARLSPPGNVYVPLPTPCRLFDVESSAGEEQGSLVLQARGEDLSVQGGSVTGCAIPEEAVALVLQVNAASFDDFPPRLKLWATDAPEPAETVWDHETSLSEGYETMAMVPLCMAELCDGDVQIRSNEVSHLSGDAVGYFRPLMAADHPSGFGGGVSFYTETVDETAFGDGALANNVTGSGDEGERNTAVGVNALNQNTTGDDNTSVGENSGASNTTGSNNSFFGSGAGSANTEGHANSFFGTAAGAINTTGFRNSFFGLSAGASNTTGSENSFFGKSAGYSNTTGSQNTFVGGNAGNANTEGSANSFYGYESGTSNTHGYSNAFFGLEAGFSNTDGDDNSFFGESAGWSNTEGDSNSFFGQNAGLNNGVGSENSFFGKDAGTNATGSYNAFFGYQSGYGATSGEDNTGTYNSFYGQRSGYSNTTGSNNSFFGEGSGRSNTTGGENAFFGSVAGYSNTTGANNAFFGESAGFSNTTGFNNAFFGNAAGEANSAGWSNSFFGREAGSDNTTGINNAFFGTKAGEFNTEGAFNSSFGHRSGDSNTVEDSNTFVGANSDLDPGPEPGTSPVTNATAIGQRAYVSQSNSLILGSIAGVNDATDDVKVGIGTTAPESPLHVKRTDGTAQILVEDTGTESTLTTLHMKNNGRVQAVYENTDTGDTWQLSQHLTGFIVSLVGTGGAEFRVLTDGSVQMGPGADITFDLDPLGNLVIGGWLTQLSDRNAKENFMPLDTQRVLEQVAQLPLTEWNFKQEEESVRHIGPMAQDFREAFGLGKDEHHISSMDTSGVALAAIQGLNEKLQAEMEEKDAELVEQQQRIQNLEAELAEIKAMLATR